VNAPVSDIVEVLVALDGSAMAERAVRPARWLAARLGATIRLVEVVDHPTDAGFAHQYLVGVAARIGAPSWTVLVGTDPAVALAEAAGHNGRILPVLASRGRHRSGQLMGSVALRAVADSDAPTVLIGPSDGAPANGGPVVVVADRDDHLVRSGAAWAAALESELVIVPATEIDQLTAALLEFRAALVVVDHADDPCGALGTIVHHAPCPVLVLPRRVVVPLPIGDEEQTMTPTRFEGEATVTELHPIKGAAHDAARREHHLAQEEAAMAAMERRAAKAATTPWQQSAHRLAAEVHSDAARSHERAAARHDLEAKVESSGLR
jgi:nucleotide-binding universal stress UspA family protein